MKEIAMLRPLANFARHCANQIGLAGQNERFSYVDESPLATLDGGSQKGGHLGRHEGASAVVTQ
jgi:hypothetical protein